MGSNGVVSIRVEALGVSITIADGSIAIEQTGIPAAGITPKMESAASRQPLRASSASTARRQVRACFRHSRLNPLPNTLSRFPRKFEEIREHLPLINLSRRLINRRHRMALPDSQISQEIPITTAAKQNRHEAMKRSRS
jgi:hypothetical protein